MSTIYFRFAIGQRILDEAYKANSGGPSVYCEALMERALANWPPESLPLYETPRRMTRDYLVGNAQSVAVSFELHAKIKARAQAAGLSITDFCSSLAAAELEISPGQLTSRTAIGMRVRSQAPISR